MKKLRRFVYPVSVEEVQGLLRRDPEKTAVIAGGTTIALARSPKVETLIDVTRLDLAYVKEEEGAVRIGATTRVADLVSAPPLRGHADGILARAASKFADPLLRNAATVGGSVITNLPYSDLAPVLLVLQAELRFADGSVSFEEYAVSRALYRKRFLTEIRLPSARGVRGSYEKLRRTNTDIATASVACCVKLGAGGGWDEVRVAVGGVYPSARRLRELEPLLRGKRPDADTIMAAGCSMRDISERILSDVRGTAEYRLDVAEALLRRALARLANGNGED